MVRYFKIWLKRRDNSRVLAYHIEEDKSVSQILFDRNYHSTSAKSLKIKKYEELDEKKFERLIKNKDRFGYVNFMEIF